MSSFPIAGFIDTSFIDWDGKITSVVFVPKCNFACRFCHNYRLVHEWGNIKLIPENIIFSYLKDNKEWIDGITITGGEPTLYGDSLFEFISKIKSLGFLVKLDTNGTNIELLKKLAEKKLVDYIAMDIKTGLNDERYEKITGVPCSADMIKKAIGFIMKCGIDYEFRTTVVPGYVTSEDITSVAKYIAGAKLYVLQQFNPREVFDKELVKIAPYSDDVLEDMAEKAGKHVKVKVRLR